MVGKETVVVFPIWIHLSWHNVNCSPGYSIHGRNEENYYRISVVTYDISLMMIGVRNEIEDMCGGKNDVFWLMFCLFIININLDLVSTMDLKSCNICQT